MLQGSPQWQHAILAFAAVFLLWQVWRGWRLGAVRGLLRLGALFCAWTGGSAAAGATGTAIAFFSKVPPLLAPAVAGLSAGLGIYLLLTLLAGLLFKTTGNHTGVVRWGFGAGGALCGLLYGLIFLLGGVTVIRGLGALGDLRLLQARREHRDPASEKTALFLIRLKASLELGVTGRRLREADPLPTAFYDTVVKISMIAGDPRCLDRFIRDPATLRILEDPNVSALLGDPAFERAQQTRNILPLLRNKHLQAALRDPSLRARILAFDLQAVLDHALGADPVRPSPSSRNSPPGPGRATSFPPKP